MTDPWVHRAENALPVLTWVVLLVVCASLIYHVTGVRGTDQYWYLADVATLADGRPPVTNTVFPGDLLRSGKSDHIAYFAHNGPLLHINALLARVTGAATAWKYSNLLFFLLAAVLTGMTARSLSSSVSTGYATTIVFLATPVNVWLAGNFLQEMFFCFLVAVILYTSVSDNGQVAKRACLLLALALGAASHPLFMIVGLGLAAFELFSKRTLIMPLSVVGIILLASLMKDTWFPTSFPPSIKDLVSASVPGVANTIWQLSDVVPQITVEFLLNKLKHAVVTQLWPSELSPFYLVSNAGLLGLLVLLSGYGRADKKFLFLSSIFMLSYAGMIVLMQNQMRYQLLIVPVSIVCVALWLSHWQNGRVKIAIFAVVMVGYVSIDYVLLNRIRTEALVEHEELVALKKELSFMETGTRVALVANNLGGWLSIVYTLAPARVMPVFPDVLEIDKLNRVMELFQPDYIFVRDGLKLDYVPNAKLLTSLTDVGPFYLDVYEVGNNGH